MPKTLKNKTVSDSPLPYSNIHVSVLYDNIVVYKIHKHIFILKYLQ
jgi:hypothetical protein